MNILKRGARAHLASESAGERAPLRLADFDFDLPQDRIALRPAEPRDHARLLVVQPRGRPQFEDRLVCELPALLRPGDILVFNDTKVIPAQLYGQRIGRGASEPNIALTLHKRIDASHWRAFAKPARKLQAGDRIAVSGGLSERLSARVVDKSENGDILLKFNLSGEALDTAIEAAGAMPLPPYIAARRPPDDRDRADYQTIYAERAGAVAAPTAGLHFTPELLKRLAERGIGRAFVTLHVGAGTFAPVKVDEIGKHKMHAEWGAIDTETAARLNETRARGGRIVAVGTTSLRLLETAALADGTVRAFTGETDIFITPGHKFRSADLLMTNFHLPRSTLFMLVAAFSGLDVMKRAYAHAVKKGYRFYSYGDACLLEPAWSN